jgi:ubiquinone/menaquinone biosynthesis C-methylase UbiE
VLAVILNVGCGDETFADVNVDLYRNGAENCQIRRRTVIRMPQSICNFVLASAEYLPFRDAAFEVVCCYHVIEHLDNPEKLMSEAMRVSNRLVKIKCPHRLSFNAKTDYHKNYFNSQWFHTALKDVPHEVSVKKILNLYPDEIRVKILKPAF